MKNHIRRALTCMVGGFVGAICVGAPVNAATITSGDFSLGYGYEANKVWGTTETAGSNIAPTGDFSLSIAPASSNFSNTGPGFVGRILTDNGGYAGWVGNASGGINDRFAAPITASYTGAAPGDAAATPNYRLQIEITSISIYGGVHSASSVTTLEFDESTPGHLSTSPSLTPTPTNAWTLQASYEQLSWDPGDFDTSLAALNDSATRTFNINAVDANDLRYLDGFEVTGRVHLIYDAIPEPASLALMGLGGLAFFSRRRIPVS